MYCYINIKGQCCDPIAMADNFELDTLKKPDGSVWRRGLYQGFNIRIRHDGHYIMKGSIWKYHFGHNCGEFTISDFKDAVSSLDELTFGSFSKCGVIGFEYGFNLKMKHSPFIYLNAMEAIKVRGKLSPLIPEYRCKKLLGKSNQALRNLFSFYNKSLVNKDHGPNILRIENTIRNVKMFFNKSLLISDLQNDKFITDQISSLRTVVGSLKCKGKSDFAIPETTSMKEIYRFLIIKSPYSLHEVLEFLQHSVKNHNTLSAEIKSIRRIYKTWELNNSLTNEIISKANIVLDWVYSIPKNEI